MTMLTKPRAFLQTMAGFSEDIAGALLTIDLGAIVANYRLLQTTTKARVAAVVKADAYGLGAVPVSDALARAGCRHFFVAHLGEAIKLKPTLLDDCEVYVLNGFVRGAATACHEAKAIPVLNSLEQVTEWAEFAKAAGRKLAAVIQVDSGMSRLGLSLEEVSLLSRQSSALDSIDIKLVMSHLACADDQSHPGNASQLASFNALAAHFGKVERSLCNSGGAFLPAHYHNDLIRAGIALYGGSPISGAPNPMAPVVRLDATVIQTRTLHAGTGVGYGLTYSQNGDRRIATIAVGYADGWPRHLSNAGFAWIGDYRVPIAGRVSMDSITLDITDVPDTVLESGVRVELLGEHQTIDDVATQAGTISYEILTQLGRRYARRYLPYRSAEL